MAADWEPDEFFTAEDQAEANEESEAMEADARSLSITAEELEKERRCRFGSDKPARLGINGNNPLACGLVFFGLDRWKWVDALSRYALTFG